MALGDTDDLACSQHGRQSPVVLYCHTCQLLLCPRCVSHGPAGEEPPHRHHTYLEIRDAHEMLKVCCVNELRCKNSNTLRRMRVC